MWIEKLRLTNIRSFEESGEIQFSKGINLLFGGNNAGKTTILRAIYSLQNRELNLEQFAKKAQRIRKSPASLEMTVKDAQKRYFKATNVKCPLNATVTFRAFSQTTPNTPTASLTVNGETHQSIWTFSGTEPDNWIFPFLSRRKPSSFQETVTAEHALPVKEAFENLYPKIDRIASHPPCFEHFTNCCKALFGFPIQTSVSHGGKQAGLVLDLNATVPVSEMGEGTKNLLGLLVSICVSEGGNLFLIEEPENDVHPKALKTLLELIIESSKKNQFIISSHSNIVAKTLGSIPETKVFSVTMQVEKGVPTSKINPLPNTPEARLTLLEGLGYDLLDFDLWSGYLILEESSAERIIRDYLIPQLVPSLKFRLRTIAARGVSDVPDQVADFLRLFVFIHTSGVYAGKAWVYTDGDKAGIDIVARLREKFANWEKDHFSSFEKPAFEYYYPAQFQSKVTEILDMPHGMQKQEAKSKLLKEVIEWTVTNPAEAREGFQISAREIIETLRKIETKLLR